MFSRAVTGFGGELDVSTPLRWPAGFFGRAQAEWAGGAVHGGLFRATGANWYARARPTWPTEPSDTLPPLDPDAGAIPDTGPDKDQGDLP